MSGISPPGVFNAPSANATNGAPLGAVATVVASMYNYYDPHLATENTGGLLTNSSNRIVFNPYLTSADISYNGVYAMSDIEFCNLFYSTNAGYFNVNPSNINNQAILLPAQTYSSSNTPNGPNIVNTFSLYQELLKAYCYNKSINVNDLDPRILLLLQKETFGVQSLATIKGTTIALGWDELIGTLTYSGIIDLSANDAHAIVPLNVILNFHSFVLDIDLTLQFVYNVALAGYVLKITPALGSPSSFPYPPFPVPAL